MALQGTIKDFGLADILQLIGIQRKSGELVLRREDDVVTVKFLEGQVVALASRLGNDASAMGDDELIPATGLLDSASILELVVWYEDAFEMPLKQDEINVDNLGSVDAMADFVLKRKAG